MPLSSRIVRIFQGPERVLVHIPSSSQTRPDSSGSLNAFRLTQRQRVLLMLPTNRPARA